MPSPAACPIVSPNPLLLCRSFCSSLRRSTFLGSCTTDPIELGVGRKRPHVSPAGDVGPMPGKYSPAVLVDLDLPFAREACSLESKVDASYACEE